MASSINDVGTAGQPLNTPPLTEWQKAVRDALNGSDVPLDSRFLKLSGGTLTGDLIVKKTSAAPVNVQLDGLAAQYKGIRFSTAAVMRWYLFQGLDAESGGNAGSTLNLNRYDDAGGSLGTVLTIQRATGNVTFNGTATFKSPTAAVPIAGQWENYVSPLTVTRSGDVVTIEGFLRWAGSTTTMTAGAEHTYGTVPSGFRPVSAAGVSTMYALTASNGALTATRGQVLPNGACSFFVPTASAGSMPNAGGWIIVNGSFRAA